MWDMGNYKCVKTLETSCGSIYSLLQSGHLLLRYASIISLFVLAY
jgi:hypothetical protein